VAILNRRSVCSRVNCTAVRTGEFLWEPGLRGPSAKQNRLVDARSPFCTLLLLKLPTDRFCSDFLCRGQRPPRMPALVVLAADERDSRTETIRGILQKESAEWRAKRQQGDSAWQLAHGSPLPEGMPRPYGGTTSS